MEERIEWTYSKQLTHLKTKHRMSQAQLGRIMGCGSIHARNYLIGNVRTIPKDVLNKLLEAFNIKSFEDVDTDEDIDNIIDIGDGEIENFTDEMRALEFTLINKEGLRAAIARSPYTHIKLSKLLGLSGSAIGNMMYRGEGSRYLGLFVERICSVLNIPASPYFEAMPDRKIVNIPKALKVEYSALMAKIQGVEDIRPEEPEEKESVMKEVSVSVYHQEYEDDDIDVSDEEINAFKANMEDKEVETVYVESTSSKSQILYEPQEKHSISTVLSNIQKNLQDIHFSPEQMKCILESIQNIASRYTYDQVMEKMNDMKRQHIFPANKDNNLILMELLDDIIADESAERYNYNIALRIKDRRAERYVSIDELATDVGITITKLRQYESGDVNIPYNIIYKIAACLNTTAEYLITGRGEKEAW